MAERRALRAERPLRKPLRAAGAEPGDVARAGRHQLLHAADRAGGRLRRAGDDHARSGRGIAGADIDARQIVAADRQRDQVALGEAHAAGDELLQFVRQPVAAGEERHGVGILGARAADREVRQPGQAVDRLQRVDEIGAAGEAAARIGRTGTGPEVGCRERIGRKRNADGAAAERADQPVRAAGRGAGVRIAVAEAEQSGELRLRREPAWRRSSPPSRRSSAIPCEARETEIGAQIARAATRNKRHPNHPFPADDYR